MVTNRRALVRAAAACAVLLLAPWPSARAAPLIPFPSEFQLQQDANRARRAEAAKAQHGVSEDPAEEAAEFEPGNGPTSSTHEQVLSVPGDADRPVNLVVTVMTPDGPGPFPLAVLNHGADGKTTLPADQTRYRRTFSAYYFLSRGYAVALPMMRGYAGSGGRPSYHGCDATLTGQENAKDIRAVIQYMARQPYIDGSRVVVGGQSYGGWNTLAVGALNIPEVKALVNFVGGVAESNCHDVHGALTRGAAAFGAKTKVPSVWFYGENDALFAPVIWRDMHGRYTEAGGQAELVDFGFFRDNAHLMLNSAAELKMWTPHVDALLKSVGLPSTPVNPGYLPTPSPPPSHYAAIDDVASVPYLSDAGRAIYMKFLAREAPRAFVVASNGSADDYAGGYDPIAEALAKCRMASQQCQLYAVDNDVVWTHPTPTPPPTRFAAIDNAAAIPYVNAAARERYPAYLQLRKPKAFVIAPDGAWNASSRGPDPLAAAMTACSAKHQGCRFYAVDDNVVWTGP